MKHKKRNWTISHFVKRLYLQFNLIFGRFFLWVWVCTASYTKIRGNYFPLVSRFSEISWILWKCRHKDSHLCRTHCYICFVVTGAVAFGALYSPCKFPYIFPVSPPSLSFSYSLPLSLSSPFFSLLNVETTTNRQ